MDEDDNSEAWFAYELECRRFCEEKNPEYENWLDTLENTSEICSESIG